ncbi:Uncharacterized protein SCG7109_AH_00060 [Chlamydiales bacterium SCGC AG-110-M15]|nr:Uncharacterized protein SCG7109_AH_00060 [Chlamydiales bacterium SCGC AG-110-M15]
MKRWIISFLGVLMAFFTLIPEPVAAVSLSCQDLLSQSPANLRLAIEEGLSVITDDEAVKTDLEFIPLEGGLSHSRLYRFNVDVQEYVLRVLDPKRLHDSDLRREKRESEVQAHRMAGLAGIAPELIYADSDSICMIMRYIDGHILNRADLQNPDLLRQLGKTLKLLHGLDNSVVTSKITPEYRVKKHYISALEKGVAFPSCFEKLYQEFMTDETLKKSADVLCHGDLNRGNILIRNDQVLLIDWAGVFVGSPYVDLGCIAILSGMSSDQENVLFSAYLEREPEEEELCLLQHAKARACFVTAAVWLDFSETEEERLAPIEERVRRLDQLLASPDLKMAHEYIEKGEVVDPGRAASKEIRLFALGYLKEYMELKSFSS